MCSGVRRYAALLLVAAIGCAPIYAQQNVLDEPLVSGKRELRVPSSLTFTATAALSDESLALVAAQSETCVTMTTPRSHRTRSITRTADPAVTRVTQAIALVGLGAGAYGYANADSLASQNGNDPGDVRDASLIGVSLGVVATIIAVTDAIRASDSIVDDGVIEGTSQRVERICERHPTRQRPVAIQLGNGSTLTATLDDEGHAALSFSAVPEAAIPAFGSVIVKVGDADVTLEMSRGMRAELLRALEADPSSRVATDLLAKRRDLCERAVETARGHTIEDDASEHAAEAALAPWKRARTTCGDLWTAELDAEVAAVERHLLELRCGALLDDVTTALAASETAAPDLIGAELAAVAERCTSPEQLVRARRLTAQLDAWKQKLARAQAAEARRAAAQEAQEARAQQHEQAARSSRPSSAG